MDPSNLAEITGGAGVSERVRMFRSFDPKADPDADPEDLVVPDPFYGDEDGFVLVIDMVERTCRRLVAELEALDL
jgi:protein-tyrosine phosphatase